MHVVQSSLMLLGVLIQPCGNSVVLIGRSLSGTEPEQPGVCNLFFHFHGLYDDLFKLQKYLNARFSRNDPVLDTLMAHKRAWMDENDVTAYMK